MLISVAFGILKKRPFAWPLGFFLIGLSAIYYVLSLLPFALEKTGFERAVLLSASIIGALLVTLYWGFIWHRQRIYFLRK